MGANLITATYSGDADFLPSTSGVLTQTVTCTRTLTGRINGGLDVSDGSTCLQDATVNGHIKVEPGAALSVSGSTLHGGISSNAALALTICGSDVRGSLAVIDTTGFVLLGDGGDDGQPACPGNSLHGSLHLDGNRGQLELGGNEIEGSVSVVNSSGTGPDQETPTSEIEGNTIHGSLACSGNSPDPTNDGQPNFTTGGASGQCAGLAL